MIALRCRVIMSDFKHLSHNAPAECSSPSERCYISFLHMPSFIGLHLPRLCDRLQMTSGVVLLSESRQPWVSSVGVSSMGGFGISDHWCSIPISTNNPATS